MAWLTKDSETEPCIVGVVHYPWFKTFTAARGDDFFALIPAVVASSTQPDPVTLLRETDQQGNSNLAGMQSSRSNENFQRNVLLCQRNLSPHETNVTDIAWCEQNWLSFCFIQNHVTLLCYCYYYFQTQGTWSHVGTTVHFLSGVPKRRHQQAFHFSVRGLVYIH